ncbi:hypothetical protein GLX30_25455 [Streptomyces sp. Tu 2975]|uniref:hypothetical protein n=1 Tax=Streptomyces sp. Tu 2975 TaxID=2676871 RepID=UPI00135C9D6C|nr:hypothetical protein [Streptomyces sp. Tu 2975]QIP86816.1 hypothetical protein GLX30_25455 [Streptomyces sp. Tu 2975]
MNGDVVGAVGAAGVFLLCIVIVWQVAATRRARVLATRNTEYRKLAEKYAQLLEDSTELHRRTLDELTQTRVSLSSMEKMMREIE